MQKRQCNNSRQPKRACIFRSFLLSSKYVCMDTPLYIQYLHLTVASVHLHAKQRLLFYVRPFSKSDGGLVSSDRTLMESTVYDFLTYYNCTLDLHLLMNSCRFLLLRGIERNCAITAYKFINQRQTI